MNHDLVGPQVSQTNRVRRPPAPAKATHLNNDLRSICYYLLLLAILYPTTMTAVVFGWSATNIPRRSLLGKILIGSTTGVVLTPSSTISAAWAFEGGIGGLGKTKPDTGVVLSPYFPPYQSPDDGTVTAEVLLPAASNKETPVLVRFTSPWPLLATAGGLETRQLTGNNSGSSAFVQVLTDTSTNKGAKVAPQTKTQAKSLLEPLFGSQGKFGAYGSPFDVKVLELVTDDDSSSNVTNGSFTCQVSFTTFTPGLRETDRQVYIRGVRLLNSWVLLVTGTTRRGFDAPVFRRVVESFVVVPAPPSGRQQ